MIGRRKLFHAKENTRIQSWVAISLCGLPVEWAATTATGPSQSADGRGSEWPAGVLFLRQDLYLIDVANVLSTFG